MSRRALIVVGMLAGVASAAPNMPRGWAWPPSRAMTGAAKACEAQLDALGVTWKSAPREGHMVDPVVVADGRLGSVTYVAEYAKSLPVMDCQLAVALANAAPALYDAGVREVHVGSTYRWSKIRVDGVTKNILSRHALGLAMDVVAFVDADGRVANVSRDYNAGDALLLAVERAVNENTSFRTVLTPKNDPKSHHDHFHLEANPDYRNPSS